MPRDHAPLPPDLDNLLRRFGRRSRLASGASALGLAGAACGLIAAAALSADRFFLLSEGARLAVSAGAAAGCSFALLAAIAKLLRRTRPLDLALRIEAAVPRLHEILSSSAAVASLDAAGRRSFSPALVEALHRRADACARDVDPRRLIDLRPAAAWLITGAVVWGGLLLALAADAEASRQLVARLLHPLTEMERPSSTRLEVSPGSVALARGDDLEVRARILRGSAVTGAVLVRQAGGEWSETALQIAGGVLSRRFSALRRPFDYRFRAGDCLSPVYSVDVREPPRARSFRFVVTRPAYTGLPPDTLERSSGDLTVLAGSTVDIAITASEPLTAAQAVLERGDAKEERPLDVAGDQAVLEGLDPRGVSGYSVILESVHGVRGGANVRYALKTVPDGPPRAEILEPRAPETIVEASSVVDLRYAASDDVGLRELEIVAKAASREPTILPVPLAQGATTQGAFALDVTRLALGPGDSASLMLRAIDKMGQEASSEPRTLRVEAVPGAPEGPDWPTSLDDVVQGLDAALRDWAKLVPGASSGAPVEAYSRDPATADSVSKAADRALSTAGFVRRIGDEATTAARSILVPSPNRSALEGLGRMLRQAAERECGAFWGEAVAAAGSLRAPPPANAAEEEHRLSAAKLNEAHRAAGARMEGALLEADLLLRAERLEDAHERAIALAQGCRTGNATSPERKGGLAREATLLGAGLLRLDRRKAQGKDQDDEIEGLSRIAVEAAARAGEGDLESAGKAASTVEARLADRYDRAEKLAVKARSRLEPESGTRDALARLASASGLAEATEAARLAAIEIEEDLGMITAMEAGDVASTSELRALREIVERLARDPAAGGGPDDVARRGREVLTAYDATAPSMVAGRIVQALDWAAGAIEDIAWKVRGASATNRGGVRALFRSAREVHRFLLAIRQKLDGTRVAGPRETALLDQALNDLRRSVESLDSGALDVEPASRAASSISEVARAIEASRSSPSPELASARAWLRAQLGTAAQRIARSAVLERGHAARARELAREAEAPGAAEKAGALLIAHEESRREVEALASEVLRERREAPLKLDASRAFDRVARALADVSGGDMLLASRGLRSVDAAAPSDRAGLLVDAAAKADRSALRLEAASKMLDAAESAEALRAASEDIERLAGEMKPAAEAAPDLARVAKEARSYLDGCLRAAEALAVRPGEPARKRALLDLLRAAAELFRSAADLASRGESNAVDALASGRAKLEEAAALARKLRGESDADLAKAGEGLPPETAGKEGASGSPSRELQAAYAELEKLLELERLEAEVEAKLAEVLREDNPDPAALAELERKQREVEDELSEGAVSTQELVELVARLVAVDQGGREVAGSERSLAASAEAGSPISDAQAALLERARGLARAFQGAGARLTAVVPQVLRAYWKASEAVGSFLSPMEEATANGGTGRAVAAKLLGAADALDAFLASAGEVRRQALEAIADAESGMSGPNAAQSRLERARRGFEEASRLRQGGDARSALRARESSRRSIADAAASLRARIDEMIVPSGAEGMLMSRVLDEEAARLGLSWHVLTRGSRARGSAEMTHASSEMAFPARFRDLVRAYMRAIEAKP